MQAAEELFSERGIGDTGVVDIALRAGVGIGTFYGRFEDKESFLRAFFDRFYDRGGRPLAAEGLLGPITDRSAVAVFTALIQTRARHYRERHALLSAVLTYTRANPNPHFRARAADFAAEAFRVLGTVLGDQIGAIAHPEPERAIRFAVWLVETSLKDQLLFGQRRSPSLTFSDAEMVQELTRAVLGYLGLATAEEDAAVGRASRPRLAGRQRTSSKRSSTPSRSL
jgi:AcrR family transcriptional regulator